MCIFLKIFLSHSTETFLMQFNENTQKYSGTLGKVSDPFLKHQCSAVYVESLHVGSLCWQYGCENVNSYPRYHFMQHSNRSLCFLLQMPTQKECHVCKTKIGVASKTCGHCGAKQPYKQKLQNIKKKLDQTWKERQKKNSSVNKVYDATNLLVGGGCLFRSTSIMSLKNCHLQYVSNLYFTFFSLLSANTLYQDFSQLEVMCHICIIILFQLHKWELLERHPLLLLARRTTNGFLAECFCPWQMDAEDAKDALVTIKRIYERLLNGNVHPVSPKSSFSDCWISCVD